MKKKKLKLLDVKKVTVLEITQLKKISGGWWWIPIFLKPVIQPTTDPTRISDPNPSVSPLDLDNDKW